MVESIKPFLSRVKLLISQHPTSFKIFLLVIGISFLTFGIFLKSQKIKTDSSIEVIDGGLEDSPVPETIVVDIEGAVENPNVYRLSFGARVNDLLIAAGGLSENADRNWVDKNLDRAAKLVDGQKVYIPLIQQSSVLSANNSTTLVNVAQSNSASDSSLVNINTGTLSELDSLPGIGPVYGQNIIDHRPYSNIEDLVKNQVLKESVYEKIKDKISVY